MQQTADGEVRKQIHRASLLLMASILVSRLIGFVRELVLARTIGASGMTDIYYASFTLPDFLNYLMAAGALSISFIPILTGLQSQGKHEEAKVVFRTLSTWMTAGLTLFVIVAEIFAETISQWVAPGFSGEQLAQLTMLTRIILPAQIFIFWGGIATAVQHTHGKFLLPALAPIVYNSGIILCGIGLHQRYGVAGFSIGVLVGAVASHGFLQWVGLRQLGYPVVPRFSFTLESKESLRRYIVLTLPIMLGFSLVVTDEWISKYFASYLGERAISWLSYARTEMRIPIAVIGQAAGIASFPYLSRLWSGKEFHKYGQTLLRELMKLWAAAPVAAILLITHAEPITYFIYGGSRMTAEDIQATAQALRFYSVGMTFWTLQLVLSRGFYASQRTWLPSILGTVLSVLAIPLYRYLALKYGHEGLAAAGSIGIFVYATLLAVWLRAHVKKVCPSLSWRPFAKFVFSWSWVIAGLAVLSWKLHGVGIYQGTHATALLDIFIATLSLVGISLVLLRTVFRRLTDGALY